MTKIKVYIITGFLGAGKTTILNELLKIFPENNGIIENEFGQINIDNSLIDSKYETLYGLTNGCICCSLENDLYNTLHKIVSEKKNICRLFIETTGIADAGNIASLFKKPDVANYFQLENKMCVIDCTQIEEQIKSIPEITRQIIACDLIILNKSGNFEIIQKKIEQLNPFCNIVCKNDKTFESEWLYLQPKKINNFFRPVLQEKEAHTITNVLFESTNKFNIEVFRERLQNLFNLYYHQIYRVKGYIQADDGSMYLVQTTGQDVFITLPKNKLETKTQIVVIGKDLQLKTVERLFNQAIAKSTKSFFNLKF